MRRIIVAMTGASGAIYGIHALRLLREVEDIETHLVLTPSAALTIRHECGLSPAEVAEIADVTHKNSAIGATIASGSFDVHAMIVAPCSIRTLSAIAYAHASDLVTRAADVGLKEGRPVLLMVRETPLHMGHLRAMTAAAEAGAIIMPPTPAWYANPTSVADIADHSVRRALARIGLHSAAPTEWQGL